MPLHRLLLVLGLALLGSARVMPEVAAPMLDIRGEVVMGYGESLRAVVPPAAPVVRLSSTTGGSGASIDSDTSPAVFRGALPLLHGPATSRGFDAAVPAAPRYLYDVYRVYRL